MFAYTIFDSCKPSPCSCGRVPPFEHTLFFPQSLAPANVGCHILLLVWKETTNIIPKRSSLCDAWLGYLYLCVSAILFLVAASWCGSLVLIWKPFHTLAHPNSAFSAIFILLCSFLNGKKQTYVKYSKCKYTTDLQKSLIICSFPSFIPFLINPNIWDSFGAFFENWAKVFPTCFNQLIHFTGLMISTTKISSSWTSYGNMAPILCLPAKNKCVVGFINVTWSNLLASLPPASGHAKFTREIIVLMSLFCLDLHFSNCPLKIWETNLSH